MATKVSYKQRFDNLARVAQKMTSSLEIGDILEMIRDEAKETIPHAREACLLIVDPDASHYTRPLHCGVYEDRLNCQLCKRGRKTVKKALSRDSEIQCAFYKGEQKCETCALGLSTLESTDKGSGPKPHVPDGRLTDENAGDAGARPCDIAFPIYDGAEPLAVLELIAEDGYCFTEKDAVLLKDLTVLASNAIVNARKHWKMSQEKIDMDRILAHLRPFVPETVSRIVEKDPAAPFLGKQELDVSVLFLDVAGYTRISESLTREKVNFIIETYFSGFLDILYAHGGDINETAGDGLMVIFQGDQKEHAVNAAQAAMEIRRRTFQINEELKGRFDPVQVNMGINSGTASVGITRFNGATGVRMTYTATGPVTNLAARIASAAEDGDILVGAETAKRIKRETPLYDRGAMAFKNVKEKVRVFSLLRAG
jgi:class 3 adenylate cyclase